MHCPYASHQQLRLHVLEQEPTRSSLQGLVDVLVHVEGCEHHDARLARCVGRDPPSGRNPVGSGHPHVHEHNIRPERRHLGQSLVAVRGFTHHVEVGLDLENHSEAGPHQRLVVDDQYVN